VINREKIQKTADTALESQLACHAAFASTGGGPFRGNGLQRPVARGPSIQSRCKPADSLASDAVARQRRAHVANSSRKRLRPYTALAPGVDTRPHEKRSSAEQSSHLLSSLIQCRLVTHRWRSAALFWPQLCAKHLRRLCSRTAPAHPARCGGASCGAFSSCVRPKHA